MTIYPAEKYYLSKILENLHKDFQAKGNLGIVELLLDSGADVNKANKDGATSLYIAIAKRNCTIINELLKAKDVMLNLKFKYYGKTETILDLVNRQGDKKLAELLASKGARIAEELEKEMYSTGPTQSKPKMC